MSDTNRRPSRAVLSRIGKSSRARGKSGERFMARKLREIWPRVITCRAGGEIVPGRDLLRTPGACVQVKRTSQPLAALKQAQHAAAPDEMPMAFLCPPGTGGRWIAVLSMSDLVWLLALARRTEGRFQ